MLIQMKTLDLNTCTCMHVRKIAHQSTKTKRLLMGVKIFDI